jgi:hypothetical protein
LSASSSPATDELDRLFRQLIVNLAELDPTRVHGPIEVHELHEQIVPYRTHRSALGIDTHEDYEMTVLRLLAGEREYAFLEPEEAREAVEKESAGVNPDVGLYRQYPHATVRFNPERVREALGQATEEIAASHAAERAPESGLDFSAAATGAPGVEFEGLPTEPGLSGAGDEGEVDRAALPFALDEEPAEVKPVTPRAASAPCAYCGGQLPVGRAVIFCPHCGQNVGIVHCPACGTELDVGWRFCITCGRQMASLG